jgi:hypothetical protein
MSAAAKKLPQFVKDLIGSPPKTGGGFHDWLFQMARVLHPFRDEHDIEAILSAGAASCGRVVPHREILDAIENSRAAAWKPGDPPAIKKERPWPPINTGARAAIIAAGHKLVDQWEESNRRWDDDEAHTEEIIDALFPGDPLLCCGKSSTEFDTKLRSEWRGELSALSLIVPSPQTARRGLTQQGKQSAHAKANTGPRKYLVIEQDKIDDVPIPVDEQAAILFHLAESAPLALVLHSGGKSLHGWFVCHDQTEKQLRGFMSYAVTLGADHITWNKAQFCRMADGTRDNGKRQMVYFFNPEVIL